MKNLFLLSKAFILGVLFSSEIQCQDIVESSISVEGMLVKKKFKGLEGTYLLQESKNLEDWNSVGVVRPDSANAPYDYYSVSADTSKPSYFRLLGPLESSGDLKLHVSTNPASNFLAKISYRDELEYRIFGEKDPVSGLPLRIDSVSSKIGSEVTNAVDFMQLREDFGLSESLDEEPSTFPPEGPSYAPFTLRKKGFLVVRFDGCQVEPFIFPKIFAKATDGTGLEQFEYESEPPQFLYQRGNSLVFEYEIGLVTVGIDSGYGDNVFGELINDLNEFGDCVNFPSLGETLTRPSLSNFFSPDVKFADLVFEKADGSENAINLKNSFKNTGDLITIACLLANWPTLETPLPFPEEFADEFSTTSLEYYASQRSGITGEIVKSQLATISEAEIRADDFWSSDHKLPILVLNMCPRESVISKSVTFSFVSRAFGETQTIDFDFSDELEGVSPSAIIRAEWFVEYNVGSSSARFQVNNNGHSEGLIRRDGAAHITAHQSIPGGPFVKVPDRNLQGNILRNSAHFFHYNGFRFENLNRGRSIFTANFGTSDFFRGLIETDRGELVKYYHPFQLSVGGNSGVSPFSIRFVPTPQVLDWTHPDVSGSLMINLHYLSVE